MRVCIDPGHGGNDSGAVGNGFYEKDLNLNISLELKNYLTEKNIDVILTRETDITLEDNERVNYVKKSNADVCISIHLNASNGEGKGVETIYQYSNQNSQRLAEIILNRIISIGLTKRRAYFKLSEVNPNTDYYFMLRLTRPITTIISECLFIDNENDMKLIKQEDGITKIAQAIGDGIIDYAGQSVIETKTPIMGISRVSVDQMEDYLRQVNKDAPFLAKIYLEEGKSEGVRGDIAFAQALLETNYFRFGGNVSITQNNFAGLGSTTAGIRGESFNSKRQGVRAHIQHLKAYASDKPLLNKKVDLRFDLVKRKSAENVEDLNGKWAVPGIGYGEKIVTILENMLPFDTSNWWQKYFYHLNKMHIVEDPHNQNDIPSWAEFAATLYKTLRYFGRINLKAKFINTSEEILYKIFRKNDTHWSRPYFETLYKMEILEEQHDYLKPPNWGELAAGCLKTLHYCLYSQIEIDANDIKGEHWSKAYFELLINYGILDELHQFDDIPNWGELAAMISKVIIYIENSSET